MPVPTAGPETIKGTEGVHDWWAPAGGESGVNSSGGLFLFLLLATSGMSGLPCVWKGAQGAREGKPLQEGQLLAALSKVTCEESWQWATLGCTRGFLQALLEG